MMIIFPQGRPKEKCALPGGSAVREATSVGAFIFPPGRPKEKCAPPGGSAVREATSVGATYVRF
jgi:hypothetical protein